jgi:alpha-ribazole phosphatase
MANIYLVRHGQTLWNSSLRFQGITDIALSEKGLWQAQKLAERFCSIPLAAVYASDLSRAFSTAECVAAAQGLSVIGEPGLREMAFGHWEGLDSAAIEERWPGQLAVFFADPTGFAVPGGETYSQLCERAWGSFCQIMERHPDDDVLVVSHGGAIRAIMTEFLQMSPLGFWRLRQDNTAVNIFTCHCGKHFLSLFNDTSHLSK